MLSWATILAALAPLLKPILEAFGATFNAGQAAKRAEQNAKDLGAAEAKIETQNATIEAQQRELDALVNAPKTVDEAIARLEDEEGEV